MLATGKFYQQQIEADVGQSDQAKVMELLNATLTDPEAEQLIRGLRVERLPSEFIVNRQLLPSVCAVYFALDANDEVVYVGETRDLRARWVTAHKVKREQGLWFGRVAYLETYDSGDVRRKIEKAAIRHYGPRLNSLGLNSKRVRP
jgi:hypothetical protein